MLLAQLTTINLQAQEQNATETAGERKLFYSVEGSYSMALANTSLGVGVMASAGINLYYNSLIIKPYVATGGIIFNPSSEQIGLMVGTFYNINKWFRVEGCAGWGYMHVEYTSASRSSHPVGQYNSFNIPASLRFKYNPTTWFAVGLGVDFAYNPHYTMVGPSLVLEFGIIRNKQLLQQNN